MWYFKLAVALIFALTVNSFLFFASHTVVLFTHPAFILAAGHKSPKIMVSLHIFVSPT